MAERDTGQRGEIIDIKVKKEVDFPVDPQERFDALVSSIGNSEAKCLTLLCLSQASLSSWELHKKFLTESGGVWKTVNVVQANYCLQTLIPIGLVAEADILYYGSDEYVMGFRATPNGLKYGQPVAAFLLQQSARFDFSLLELFGKTSIKLGEQRSPVTRVKILEFLNSSNHGSFRTKDIEKQIGIVSAAYNLEHFDRFGLVEYRSTNVEQPGFAVYKLSEGVRREQVQTIRTSHTLTSKVGDLLFQLKTVNAPQIYDLVKDQYPNRKDLKSEISRILTGLSRQGICNPELFIGGDVQSDVRITRLGKLVVEDVLMPLKRALGDDEYLLGQWRAIPWEEYARNAVLKYRQSSGYANKRPVEDWTLDTFNVIRKNPGIRSRDLRKLLGHNLHIPLKRLLDNGVIRKEGDGRAVFYYPVN